MRFSNSTTALVLGMLGMAQAHAVLKYVYINGESPGVGTCLRSEHEGNNKPIEDVTSNDMACGFDGTNGVGRVCPINPGDDLTFEWFHWHSQEFPELYYPDGHMGPCSIMMKKVDSAINSTGTGDGWFRIGYEGYNNQTKFWCGQRVAAEGRLTVKIPEDLEGGSYLIRPELVALHNTQTAPQLYVSCFQVFLNSAGTAVPKDTVAIPGDGYISQKSKAMTWDLFDGGDQSLYPDYGPPTYKSTGKAGTSNLKQTEGLRKQNCVVETHSFCAVEVPKYSNGDECWKSNKNCWDQAEVCWKSVPLDGTACKEYAKRCEAIGESCKAGGSGPPDEGKIIYTGVPPALNPIPPPLDTLGSVRPKLIHNPENDGKNGAAYPYGNAAIAHFDSNGKEIESVSAPTTAAAFVSGGASSSVDAASASSTANSASSGGSSEASKTASSTGSMVTGGSDYGSVPGSNTESPGSSGSESSTSSPTASGGSSGTGGSDYGSVPSSNAESPESNSESSKSEASSPTTTKGPSGPDATSICTETETDAITDIVIETVTVTANANPTPNAYRHRRRHVGGAHH
ncbi:MAG: hypothetical protein M1816_005495 [Peltula sp. TS41687]|nr:MAG: hypothetical protein M1816_005495 [Peltula sp. TS41687]